MNINAQKVLYWWKTNFCLKIVKKTLSLNSQKIIISKTNKFRKVMQNFTKNNLFLEYNYNISRSVN